MFEKIKSFAPSSNNAVKTAVVATGAVAGFAALWAASCAITVAVGETVIDVIS